MNGVHCRLLKALAARGVCLTPQHNDLQPGDRTIWSPSSGILTLLSFVEHFVEHGKEAAKAPACLSHCRGKPLWRPSRPGWSLTSKYRYDDTPWEAVDTLIRASSWRTARLTPCQSV